MTFVSVGNATQSFTRLIDAVLQIAPHLPQPLVIQHGNSVFQRSGFISRPFMGMEEFCNYMSNAELLILHAGAGSVTQALQADKLPVVMPRRAKYGEIVDDHQLEFALAMARAGKVVLAEEPIHLMDAVGIALKQQQTQALRKTTLMVDLISAVLSGYAQGSEK
jgi:UDP-N-acetylglucosamine transferase subunit ALG13